MKASADLRTRLIEGDDDIDCSIDGFRVMQCQSEVVKKA